jgi:hypothetical protein
MKVFFLLLGACIYTASSLFAASVRLTNDSAYPLRAVIRSADGSYLGEVVINAGQSSTWRGGYGDQSIRSQTPYNVHWYCLDGGDFSFCAIASVGSTITANGCDGLRACKPPKKKKGSTNPEQPEQYISPYPSDAELQQEGIGPPTQGNGPP